MSRVRKVPGMVRTPGRLLRSCKRHNVAWIAAGNGIKEAAQVVRDVRRAFVATNWGFGARRAVRP